MGGGVSSDTGRQQGLDLLKSAYSKGQLSGAIGIMQQDIAARKSALVGSNRYLMRQYGQPKAQSSGKVLVEGGFLMPIRNNTPTRNSTGQLCASSASSARMRYARSANLPRQNQPEQLLPKLRFRRQSYRSLRQSTISVAAPERAAGTLAHPRPPRAEEFGAAGRRRAGVSGTAPSSHTVSGRGRAPSLLKAGRRLVAPAASDAA
jgi:hypothetical protein